MSDYSLFSVMGIEIEYMLVHEDTLDIQPQSDLILRTLAGEQVNEVVLGDIALSNELVMHVIELKNNGPKSPQTPIAEQFQQTINALAPLLSQHQLQLLPTGAHPWMNPGQETKRWPYGNQAIYKQYDMIFNCQGHGWANLQSMHVNLPFASDEEFFQLHTGVRLLLPLLPALAASTPILDGKPTGLLDSRLSFYAKNQQRIPSISGEIIPEISRSRAEYERNILAPMYRDICPLDPNGLLQHEWLNSRAAIAKFDSMAIEIRIIDSQECVHADIAIARAVHAILKSWHESTAYHLDHTCPTQLLKSTYEHALKSGLSTPVDSQELLVQWQLPKRSMTLRDVWSFLIERVSGELDDKSQRALEAILVHGNLSERILHACQQDFSRSSLKRVYRQLGDCLRWNEQLMPS